MTAKIGEGATVWRFLLAAVIASTLVLGLATSLSWIAILVVEKFDSSARHEWSSWVQATGTVIAIVAGFFGVLHQISEQKRNDAEGIAALGRAAHTLAAEATILLTDRLNAALQPGKAEGLYALRGARTTEMVSAMRDFDAGALPTALIPPFVRLRSCIVAINERIADVYRDEEAELRRIRQEVRGKKRRRQRQLLEVARQRHAQDRFDKLASSLRVHRVATQAYDDLDRLAAAECSSGSRRVHLPVVIQMYRDQVVAIS